MEISPKAQAKISSRNARRMLKTAPQCFVYVMGRADLSNVGPVKIGISDSPDVRLRQINTASPFRVVIRHKFNMPRRDIALSLESNFHRIQSSKRLNGEWFDIPPVSAILSLCIGVRIHLLEIGFRGRELSDALSACGVADIESVFPDFRNEAESLTSRDYK